MAKAKKTTQNDESSIDAAEPKSAKDKAHAMRDREAPAAKTIDKKSDPEIITSNSIIRRGPAKVQIANRPDNR